MDLFKSPKTARRRLRRLVDRRRLRIVGVSYERGQKARNVFAVRPVKIDNVEHEMKLGSVLRAIKRAWDGCDIEVGSSLPHLADAIVCRDGETLFIEQDNDTMGYAEIRRRLDEYDGCEGFIVFIADTDTRRDGILRNAVKYKDIAYACTMRELLDKAQGEILLDCEGARGCLFSDGGVADDGENPGEDHDADGGA